MLALPTTDWRSKPWSIAEALAAAPVAADWRAAGDVEHGFTHFRLTLSLFQAEGDWAGASWRPRAEIESMPSVFLKAARTALRASALAAVRS